MTEELVLDGVLSQDQTQFTSIWSLRELLPEACGKAGSVYKYDLSVPVSKMYSLVEKMRERLRERGVLEGDGSKEGRIRGCVGYGHMGDGNLHINIIADKYSPDLEEIIEPYIYELVCELAAQLRHQEGFADSHIAAEKGSISAEHGLGEFSPYNTRSCSC